MACLASVTQENKGENLAYPCMLLPLQLDVVSVAVAALATAVVVFSSSRLLPQLLFGWKGEGKLSTESRQPLEGSRGGQGAAEHNRPDLDAAAARVDCWLVSAIIRPAREMGMSGKVFVVELKLKQRESARKSLGISSKFLRVVFLPLVAEIGEERGKFLVLNPWLRE